MRTSAPIKSTGYSKWQFGFLIEINAVVRKKIFLGISLEGTYLSTIKKSPGLSVFPPGRTEENSMCGIEKLKMAIWYMSFVPDRHLFFNQWRICD